MKKQLKTEAGRKLESFLKTKLAGFYQQAIDRLEAAGVDCSLRSEASEQNALALLWIARNR